MSMLPSVFGVELSRYENNLNQSGLLMEEMLMEEDKLLVRQKGLQILHLIQENMSIILSFLEHIPIQDLSARQLLFSQYQKCLKISRDTFNFLEKDIRGVYDD